MRIFYRVHTLETWLKTSRLNVSTTKSTLTLITPWNREYTRQPPVTLDGELFLYTNYPTTLGVTYDRGMTFGQYIQNINTKKKTSERPPCTHRYIFRSLQRRHHSGI